MAQTLRTAKDGIYFTKNGRVQKVKGQLIYDNELRQTIKSYVCNQSLQSLFHSGLSSSRTTHIYTVTAHIPNSGEWIVKSIFLSGIKNNSEYEQFNKIILPDKDKVWIAYRDILKCGTAIGRVFGFLDTEL